MNKLLKKISGCPDIGPVCWLAHYHISIYIGVTNGQNDGNNVAQENGAGK